MSRILRKLMLSMTETTVQLTTEVLALEGIAKIPGLGSVNASLVSPSRPRA